ncbi:MAG: SMC-Scp complex subunit ScpB [Flavisolibacter sp.]
MEISNLIPHIEALIFASDKPLTGTEITELVNLAFGFMEDKVVEEQVDAAIDGIVEKYSAEFYPFEVRQSGGGWQFLTKKYFHKTVAQLNGEKFLKRLSAAALETLAIIAYKQPVTKGEIEAIRGVSTDYAVQKLLEKELIVITGRNEKLPGHPLVYATSKSFMDYFGINSPEDLPRIKEVLSSQLVEATPVHHTDFEQSETLAVSDEGQLITAQEDSEVADSSSAKPPEDEGLSSTEPPEGEEDQINGHAFEMMEGEDEATEEAIEDFIADESFIEADETEEETEKDEEEDGDDDNGKEKQEGKDD